MRKKAMCGLMLSLLGTAVGACGGSDDKGRAVQAGGGIFQKAETKALEQQPSQVPGRMDDRPTREEAWNSQSRPAPRERAKITSVIRRLYSVTGGTRWRRMCDLLSVSARQEVIKLAQSLPDSSAKATCTNAVRSVARRSVHGADDPSRRRVHVTDVTVDGDQATAVVGINGEASSAVPFVKENGRWKLASVATELR